MFDISIVAFASLLPVLALITAALKLFVSVKAEREISRTLSLQPQDVRERLKLILHRLETEPNDKAQLSAAVDEIERILESIPVKSSNKSTVLDAMNQSSITGQAYYVKKLLSETKLDGGERQSAV